MRIIKFYIFFIFIFFNCLKSEKFVDLNKDYSKPKVLTGITKYDNVRVRKLPTIDSEIIEKLKINQKIEIIGRTENKYKINNLSEDYWYKVKTKNNNEGWVFGSLIYIENQIDDLSIIKNNEQYVINNKSLLSFKNKIDLTIKPILKNYLFCFLDIDNIVRCINIKTGEEIWNIKLNSNLKDQLTLDEDLLFFNTENCLYCYNFNNCKKLWSYTFDKKNSLIYKIYNKNLIIALNEKIIILNKLNGIEKKNIKINSKVNFINVIDDLLYYITNDGYLNIININNLY